MASQKLMESLDAAIARELQVSIQYMWQHVVAMGMLSAAVSDIFKEIAITEMKHAEKIAERLNYFGGIPTTLPTKITVGTDLEEMLRLDVKAEEDAIAMYRKIIALAAKEGDTTTRLLFEETLSAEEEHHDQFTTLLERSTPRPARATGRRAPRRK